ncbi:MAG: hypothetical protein VYA55_04990 [Pseudomonadota bacterium]|nr:hypothetical protein [Pseudomonadota bacterium]
MSVNRRFFLQSSCGAVVAIAASPLVFSHFFDNPGSSSTLVMNTIRKRFPAFDFSGNALQQFANMIVHKDVIRTGTSSFSLQEIFDTNEPTITFERYIMREFILNTNYLSHQAADYPGLEFVPFEQQQGEWLG